MIFCEETFNDFGKGMDDLVNAGTNMVELNTVFSNLLDVCNFHIDESRDDRGFTVLMIAAQNLKTI